MDFEAQYIRTGVKTDVGPFPIVSIIHSSDELKTYYETSKDKYDLERRKNPAADSTIGFLDACDKYNDDFFEKNALVFIVLEEGSGSTRHNVEYVRVDKNGLMYVNILSVDPEICTWDMAYWHIITEIPKDKLPENKEDVVVDYNGAPMSKNHAHGPTNEEQTVDDPVTGYCGNTQTTIYFDNGKSYTFMGSESVALTDLLVNLKYDPNKLCKCLPEYKIDTEFGIGYGIRLDGEGYARCDKGQAELTAEQIETATNIIEWAKDKAK